MKQTFRTLDISEKASHEIIEGNQITLVEKKTKKTYRRKVSVCSK
jgi:hypothetical protein